jgi:hypothetical protein
MLAVPRPIPPVQLKRVVELRGYKLIDEDEWNWAFAKDDGVPITIPKDGEYVAVDVMMDTLHKTGTDLGTYFTLRDQSAKELGLQPN